MNEFEKSFFLVDELRRSHCISHIAFVPLGDDYTVRVERKKETRTDVQNRLMWHWWREISNHTGEDSDFIHGQMKLEHLLPLLRGTDPVIEWLHGRIIELPRYSSRVRSAYVLIRSKGRPVKLFAEFLTRVQREANENGIILTTGDDLRFEEEVAKWGKH